MIFHPGAIALLTSSIFIVALICYISPFVLKLLKNWDMTSSSAKQLQLERKTFLVSAMVKWLLALQVLSAFLFIFTADEMHSSLLGAMCATGSLNANPVGWFVLLTKTATAMASGVWLALNQLDGQAEDYPLIWVKYVFLLCFFPFIVCDAALQAAYFAGLDPKVITSCCGALFGGERGGVASSLASLPAEPMMAVFYGFAALLAVNAFAAFKFKACRYLLSGSAFLFLLAALASVISFIAPYYYQLPTHHCPFDILQSNYYFVGWPIYLALFGGVVFLALPGATEPFAEIASLAEALPAFRKKWLIAGLALTVLFVCLASAPILFSSFSMLGY